MGEVSAELPCIVSSSSYLQLNENRKLNPYEYSVVPSRSEDELGTTKVTDRSNYTLLTKAQHKDEDDDESVDKLISEEPVKTNATEIAMETKPVEPEEESNKVFESNSIESRIETKNMKPKHEKVK